MRKVRFLSVTGAVKTLHQATIALPVSSRPEGLRDQPARREDARRAGDRRIHDPWQVEASFRMTRRDLKARPVLHYQRDAIEAHLQMQGDAFGEASQGGRDRLEWLTVVAGCEVGSSLWTRQVRRCRPSQAQALSR